MNTAPYQCRFGSYKPASPHDRAVLASLLRERPLYGDMRLLIKREPNFFADRNPFGKQLAIVGRSPQGNPMFLCELREYSGYIGGKISRVVHLGMLRVAREYSRQAGVLEHGFVAVRSFARKFGFAEEFFTTVSSGDAYFRTIFESRAARFPRFSFLGDLRLAFLPAFTSRTSSPLPEDYAVDPAGPEDMRALEGLLAASGSAWSYAPSIDSSSLLALLSDEKSAIGFSDMLILRHKGLPVGCVGIWDQRAFRQQWVDAYSLGTALLRPIRNMLARARGMPLQPSPGSRLEMIALPFFSLRHAHIKAGKALLERALCVAGAKGGQTCALAFSDNNPLYSGLHIGGQSQSLRVYHVAFPGEARMMEGKFFAPQPELAIL